MIETNKIRTDGGTQSRAAINEQTVAEYAEAMADPNTVFPPIIVYYDGRDHWLADGFHRLEAWRRIGRVEVPCEIRQGDRRQAILHSVAANSAHGLRRTNDDKRRAVLTLLEDDEWRRWTDTKIANQCGVSQPFVSGIRRELSQNGFEMPTSRKVERGGATYTVDTTNIGKTEKPAPAAQPEPDRSQTEVAQAPKPKPEPEPDQNPIRIEANQEQTEDHDPVHAEKLDAAPDPHAAVRKALKALTRDGLEDEVIGLRKENAELRKRVKKQTGDIADLKARITELEADEKNGVVRALQQRVKVAGNAQWKAEEDLSAWKRKCFALERRVRELEGMEITL